MRSILVFESERAPYLAATVWFRARVASITGAFGLAWFGLPERELLSAASVLSFGLANRFLTNLQRK